MPKLPVFAAVACLVLVSCGPGISSDTPTISSPSPEPTPDITGADSFMPASTVSADRASLDLTFVDGTTATIEWPAELDLMSLGVRPEAVAFRATSEGPDGRWLAVYHGTVESLPPEFGRRELLSEYDDGAGGTVVLWRFEGWEWDYLTFQFGEWVVQVYDYRNSDRMTEEDRAWWARSLQGEQTADGFLLLHADHPLEIGGPDEQSGMYAPVIAFRSPQGWLRLRATECDPESVRGELGDGDGYAEWCDPSGRMLVRVEEGSEEFQQAVLHGLEIRDVEFASGSETVAEAEPLGLPQEVPLRIVAVRPNNPSLAVIDLESGTNTLYPPGEHELTGDAVDNAVITPTGDTIISASGVARRFEDRFDELTTELTMSPRPPGSGVGDGFWVVPAVAGDQVWLVRPGYVWDEGTVDGSVELVELVSGDVIYRGDLEYSAQPAGAVLGGLVIGTSEYKQASPDAGWTEVPGCQRTWLLAINGTLTDLGPGYPVIADGSILARQVCETNFDDCDLAIEDLRTGEVAIPQPPEGMHWVTIGGQLIPTSSLPLPTVSPDEDQLLLAATTGFDSHYQARWELHAIELATSASTLLGSWEGPARMATWSRDGRWVALITNTDVTLIDTTNLGTDPIMLEGLWPDDHFPLAAG